MLLGRLDVFICLKKFFGDVVSIEESAEGASPSGTREWRARERSDPRASPASHRATRRAHSDPDTPSDVEGKTRGRPDPAVKSARVCDACAGSCVARATRSTTRTTWGPRPTVVKVLKKNVRVKTTSDGVWNVTASLLKAA